MERLRQHQVQTIVQSEYGCKRQIRATKSSLLLSPAMPHQIRTNVKALLKCRDVPTHQTPATVSGCLVKQCALGISFFIISSIPRARAASWTTIPLFSFPLHASTGYILCCGVYGAFPLGCLRVFTHIRHIPVLISFSHIVACYAHSLVFVSLIGW